MLTWSLNHGRTPANKWAENMAAANELLAVAMQVAAKQVRAGRYVVCAHPSTAKSWSTAMVRDVAAMPGVPVATF